MKKIFIRFFKDKESKNWNDSYSIDNLIEWADYMNQWIKNNPNGKIDILHN